RRSLASARRDARQSSYPLVACPAVRPQRRAPHAVAELFRGLHRRGVAGAAVCASARVLSHCSISARSGDVSGVSSTASLLLSVAAAVAIVGASASRPERLLVGLSGVTVTAAITASRSCLVNVGSPNRSGCEIAESAAPVVADITMRAPVSTDTCSCPRLAPSSSRSCSIWNASRNAALLVEIAGDQISL